MGGYDKEKAAAKRAAFRAAGLTSKGKPRKGRAKPDPQPHQHIRFSKKRKLSPPKPRAKNETPEQRRERGRMMKSSPLGLDIEESIAKRLRAMG